jgi:hypothetical protein
MLANVFVILTINQTKVFYTLTVVARWHHYLAG